MTSYWALIAFIGLILVFIAGVVPQQMHPALQHMNTLSSRQSIELIEKHMTLREIEIVDGIGVLGTGLFSFGVYKAFQNPTAQQHERGNS